MPASFSVSEKKIGGLVSRKERWGLTWRGWLLAVFLLVLTGWVLMWKIYPFLALTHRVDSEFLVVEGWVHNYSIEASIVEFKAGGYQRVFTTGGPVRGEGGYTNDFNTSASVGAERLVASGMAENLVQMVPSRVIDRDRTYSSAVALKEWLTRHHITVRSFNIVTEDVHARRTRMLFQRAFGDDVSIGVISVSTPEYNANRWWLYSDGVQEVIRECIACTYAKLFFHPARSPDK